jgi:cyclopropane fatty-acyl-phospholipid synthase-like methyltransferase
MEGCTCNCEKEKMKKREFPDWENKYKEEDVETMPWFYPDLDPDLQKALYKLKINSGRALDLGTGPGTQAIALAKEGFDVTGSDFSITAVEKAREKVKGSNLKINFVQDDILRSKLNHQFDIVFDRGCFHVFPPEQRMDYVNVIKELIKPKGYLFLKCFSYLEKREEGPYRFTPKEIEDYFRPHFSVYSIEDTVFHGTLDPFPKALFSILKRI